MRLTIALTTALALAIPYSAAAEQATRGFRIMDQAEAAKYREKLENLQGEAREKYRNQVYAQLRQRAWDHGYEMPAKPPWWGKAQAGDETFRPPEAQPIDDQGPAAAQSEAAQPPAPQSAAETEAKAPDMPKQIAQQKQVIEEAAVAESQPDAAGVPAGEASDTPTANTYREQMRRRFDDFMARREERQRKFEEKQRARWQQSMPPNSGRPMQPQAPAMPPAAPMQPQYPQPMQPGPGYPMPPQQPAYPGYPPYGYPPPAQPAPGWY